MNKGSVSEKLIAGLKYIFNYFIGPDTFKPADAISLIGSTLSLAILVVQAVCFVLLIISLVKSFRKEKEKK